MVEAARENLRNAAARAGVGLVRLSRLLGRNDAYLQQFVGRGSPRVLPERERRILADYLGLSEAALGGPEDTVPVRRLDVAASAGPGALSDDDRITGVERMPATMLRRLALDPSALSMIVARGDSMTPTIADGDDILVDTTDRRVRARAAIFVLRIDSTLVVKRLRLAGEQVIVSNDNPAAPPILPIPLGQAEVVGRVVWLGRKV